MNRAILRSAFALAGFYLLPIALTGQDPDPWAALTRPRTHAPRPTSVDIHPDSIRKHLKSEHRWFADLMSPTRNLDRIARFMAAPTEVKGVPVQVNEVTGEPGDLWVMHPAALHAPASNALDAPLIFCFWVL